MLQLLFVASILLLFSNHVEAWEISNVQSLGCWNESDSDRAISGDFGTLDLQGCYAKAISLGYSVFAINNGTTCYTSPIAWSTFKKYGLASSSSCNDSHSNDVYKVLKGANNHVDKDIGEKESVTKDMFYHSMAYVGFASYALAVIANLIHSLKKQKKGRLLLGHGKSIFRAVCFLLAGYMGLTQVVRYFDNEDASSINYKTFNETPLDIYPTFSICLHATDEYPLHHFLRKEVQEKAGVSEVQFDQILKGASGGMSEERLSNILNLEYDQFKLEFDTFLNAVGLEEQNEKLEHHNDTQQFFTSYKDPNNVCFSLKSSNHIGIFRQRDWVSLKKDKLEEARVLIQAYVHYPGRLAREIGRPNFELDPDHLDDDHTKTTLQLNRLSILRKRPDANVPCNSKAENDDSNFRMFVIKQQGCIPMYWQDGLNSNDSFKQCIKSSQMENIYEQIKNKNNVFNKYDQPCDYMEVSLGATQHSSSFGNVVLLELQYMKQNYQEIVNIRDFEFESFWSSVGGFVGIFLGYSLLRVPDLMETLFEWFQTKQRKNKDQRKQKRSNGNSRLMGIWVKDSCDRKLAT